MLAQKVLLLYQGRITISWFHLGRKSPAPHKLPHHHDQVYFHAEVVMLTRQKIVELLQAKSPYLAAEFGVS
jgi:hypothetical protein